MDLIDALTEPKNLIAAGAAILGFATIVTLGAPLLKKDALEGRLKSVANRREELRRRSREALSNKEQGGLRQTDESVYRKVVENLNLQKLLEDPKVADRLAQAGFRGPKPVSTFYFFRFALPPAIAFILTHNLFLIH